MKITGHILKKEKKDECASIEERLKAEQRSVGCLDRPRMYKQITELRARREWEIS